MIEKRLKWVAPLYYSMEGIQSVEQGACTCGESDDNYTQTYQEFNDVGISRLVRCQCGERAAIHTTSEGIETVGPISHEEASWNEE